MNSIREIVTKAVVGKGKKLIKLKEKIKPQYSPNSILGCLVINHRFEAKRIDEFVEITGSFELNVWYSHDDYLKTSVAKETVEYSEKIKIVPIVSEVDQAKDVIVKMVQQPTCLDGIITLDMVELDIVFETSIDVIGEAKISISILDRTDIWPDDFDIDNSVDENFIKEKEN